MFIKAQGRHLSDPNSGNPLILRGFNFTQNYWMATETILSTGKDDQAYQYASRLGANSIRLTVRHGFLEPLETPFVYSDEALNWLDLQIQHAKRNGLYVSIAFVLPHGGDWLDKNEGKDFRLWHYETYQNRFIGMWKTLATRYAKESTVLGYDLFNVPVTDDYSGAAYYALLEKTIKNIRSVDSEHLIVVSKLYGSRGEIDPHDAAGNYRKLSWSNILYDGHFYDPVDYTHQYAHWIGNNSDGGHYPDDSILEEIEKGEEMPRNKAYLKHQLKYIFEFGENNVVPVHIGEIGLVPICYQGKGGLNWIADVLELLDQREIGFFYWDFQSQAMGLVEQSARSEERRVG